MRCLLFLLIFPAIFAAQKVEIKDLNTKILNGAKNGAAYVSIYNGNSQAITLYKVEVQPEVFNSIELHNHVKRVDVHGIEYMEMIEIPEMEIAPGQTLFLEPGFKHLMLMEIKPTYCQAKTLTFKFFFRDGKGQEFKCESCVAVAKGRRCGD